MMPTKSKTVISHGNPSQGGLGQVVDYAFLISPPPPNTAVSKHRCPPTTKARGPPEASGAQAIRKDRQETCIT